MTDQPTLAELSRQVAGKLGWAPRKFQGMTLQTVAEHPEHGIAVWPDFTEPARLWELEGECQERGWNFRQEVRLKVWVAAKHEQPDEVMFDKDRVMLVLRAWLSKD